MLRFRANYLFIINNTNSYHNKKNTINIKSLKNDITLKKLHNYGIRKLNKFFR